MFTKLLLRPQPFPFTLPFPTPLSSFKPFTLSLPSSAVTATSSSSAVVTLDHPHHLPYGPSLHKGLRPSHHHYSDPSIKSHREEQHEEDDDVDLIDEERFARFYDIAAIRVPSDRCFVLESRLRGHLLNWPRIRNIARVPGDDFEEGFEDLLGDASNSGSGDDSSKSLASLNRRIYGKAEGDGEPLSAVLYRDKLANTFNSRGYAKFRNLAKMSRPKKGKKREEGPRERRGIGKNELAMVEVVEEEGEEDGEDLSGLLGDEFKGRKWRGSTRLLLLDERCARKSFDELPEAIKVSVPTL